MEKEQLPELKHINVNDFNITEKVIGIPVQTNEVAKYMKMFKGLCYNRIKTKCVIPYNSERMILLETPLKEQSQKLIQDNHLETIEAEVPLTIKNFNVNEIMKKYINKSIQLPSSFETVGTLAHMNLKEEQMEFKYIIGEAFLIKNYPRIQTVITKTAEISNEFRTFPLEVIAGIPNTEVTVICHGVKFVLDFAQCYWNTRLETEHIRIINQMKPGEILCDAFAGVGPFAIPAALKGVKVYANDLNPTAVKYMRINAVNNKTTIECDNMDARDYLRKIVIEKHIQPNYILMNLPATAIEFLDCIPELYLQHCMIHCYGFSPLPNAEDLKKRAFELLKGEYPITIREVRDVAPKKIMYCLSIFIESTKHLTSGNNIPEAKKTLN
ncbi:hypothetical protein, conserved [Entamoeba dispar SAW760]|uniref:tRNA (guanine(37)-N1)-methyltransferase n=1 Tax=Entamoeba dispar (strain ATCC PRA-260 / SAW760) TaxID=370354 RepID=B0EA02_ENTDS|nr:uncharacterized protein EDI_311840 [Entamoeba dispar SAW760]EDR28651.1 hypothetical protein, conserved [Entamoeba dispar SAW760]|eukprot:EDR28651.1 hypothetical protein, conserved [Entamoeba dispar SAW760]